MKKNEIALLVLIVGIVSLASYFLVKTLIGGSEPKAESVESVVEIRSGLTERNKDIFAEGNYNPTIKIRIGDQSNQQPFNAAQQ